MDLDHISEFMCTELHFLRPTFKVTMESKWTILVILWNIAVLSVRIIIFQSSAALIIFYLKENSGAK